MSLGAHLFLSFLYPIRTDFFPQMQTKKKSHNTRLVLLLLRSLKICILVCHVQCWAPCALSQVTFYNKHCMWPWITADLRFPVICCLLIHIPPCQNWESYVLAHFILTKACSGIRLKCIEKSYWPVKLLEELCFVGKLTEPASVAGWKKHKAHLMICHLEMKITRKNYQKSNGTETKTGRDYTRESKSQKQILHDRRTSTLGDVTF